MINVIGLGPGNTDYITKLGEKLIQNSDVVICLLYTSPSPLD